MLHPTLFYLTRLCLCCLTFISLNLKLICSASFKLRLELKKIGFILFSLRCILNSLSTNQSQILLKFLVNSFLFQWLPLYWKSKYESSAYRCKLDSVAWLISPAWIKNCTGSKIEPNPTWIICELWNPIPRFYSKVKDHQKRVLLNRSPNSTRLHPPPPSSFQPPPVSIYFDPAHFSLHPALSMLLEPKLGNFPKFRPKNSTLSILTEIWHTWYLRMLIPNSGVRFLKSPPQNPFLCKFEPRKSKLSVLPEKLARMVSWGC